MKTIDTREAAKLLKMSVHSLCQKAHSGEIPAAKPGRKWVFIEEDLIAYMRKLYTENALKARVPRRGEKCLSLSAAKRGGSALATTDSEYAKALGLQKEQKHNNYTTK